ncbi:unnamed protein product [Bathycoccus prasinos]
MTPVTSTRLNHHHLASEQPKEEKVLSQQREEGEKDKDKEAGDDDAIDYDQENVCSSPRTVALDHFRDDRLLQSARLLRKICDSLVLSSEEEEEGEEEEEEELKDTKEKEKEKLVKYVLEKAKQSESFIEMLREDAEKDSSWETQKSFSFCGRDQTKIYYKTMENDTKLILRVDQAIKREMLIPVLATLNESQLYASWLPSWTMPKLKFSRTEKLDQRGRCSQLLLVTVECPWPFSTREVVLDALAFDDIDESGVVAVLLNSCDCEDDERVPAIDHKFGQCTRVDFHGGFLFRAIPSEGEAWKKAREKHEDEMIVSFIFNIDPKISYVPVSIIQFITRTVIGTLWGMFMKIASKVKNGEMKEHAEAIQSKRLVLYDWVDERVKSMFARIF